MARTFPKPPSLHASWAPVYLEPIMHSGERITIGIAATTENGETTVVPTLTQKQLSCVYGERDGAALFNIVQLGLESLSDHLKESAEFLSWESPFSGINLGQHRETVSDDLSSLVQIAMRLTASFSSLLVTSQGIANVDAIAAHAMDEDRWNKRIYDSVVRDRPSFKDYFNRSVSIVQGAPLSKFDFFGRHYVANFGRLIPAARSITKLRNSAKARLWDLARLRDAAGVKGNIHAFDLILWRPPVDDMAYSESEMKTLGDTIIELSESAKAEGVTALPVFTADQARARVIELEEAA